MILEEMLADTVRGVPRGASYYAYVIVKNFGVGKGCGYIILDSDNWKGQDAARKRKQAAAKLKKMQAVLNRSRRRSSCAFLEEYGRA